MDLKLVVIGAMLLDFVQLWRRMSLASRFSFSSAIDPARVDRIVGWPHSGGRHALSDRDGD